MHVLISTFKLKINAYIQYKIIKNEEIQFNILLNYFKDILRPTWGLLVGPNLSYRL